MSTPTSPPSEAGPGAVRVGPAGRGGGAAAAADSGRGPRDGIGADAWQAVPSGRPGTGWRSRGRRLVALVAEQTADYSPATLDGFADASATREGSADADRTGPASAADAVGERSGSAANHGTAPSQRPGNATHDGLFGANREPAAGACPNGAAPDAAPDAGVDGGNEPSLDRGLDVAFEVVRRLAQRAGPADRDVATLKRRLQRLRRLEGATTAAIATTVAAIDDVGGVTADGASSKAAWLKANTGRSGREAARLSRLAENLDELPGTADALCDGRLSAEAADAIVQASRDGRLGMPEDAEAELLPVATDASPEELRRHIRRRQQQADGAAMLRDELRQRARRRVSLTQRDDGGMWELHGLLPNEVGTRLRTALDAFDHADPAETPVSERRRPEQRLADALATMTDAVLDHGLAPTSGGVVRPHLSVIVDADTVTADMTSPDASDPQAADAARAPDDPAWASLAPGATAWGGQLSPQAVRRISCDAALSRIVMAGESQVLDVGRTTRDWSGPQRRAVHARDRGCRGPGCDRPIAWTVVHHVHWWRRGGGTSVDNGLALCHHCHHLVHDRGWTVAFDPATAEATWTSPTGAVTTTRPHPRATGPPGRAGDGATRGASGGASGPPSGPSASSTTTADAATDAAANGTRREADDHRRRR